VQHQNEFFQYHEIQRSEMARTWGLSLRPVPPNVHAGRLTETTRPPTKNSSKILQKSSMRTVRLRCRIP
jgi:hypothetical protein